jgi:sugar lactone lactonase YvrE
MHFPNGSVITPDGKTLILGETLGSRLTAFDIGADGTLTNRRVWPSCHPECPTASR